MLSPNVLRVCVMLSGCIVAKFVVKIFKTHSLSNSGFSHINILNFEKVHQPLTKREKDVSPILINSINNLTIETCDQVPRSFAKAVILMVHHIYGTEL